MGAPGPADPSAPSASPLHETPADEATAQEVEESPTEGRVENGVQEEVQREVRHLHRIEYGLESTVVGDAQERQHLRRRHEQHVDRCYGDQRHRDLEVT